MGYTHIDEDERRRIERAVDSGKGVREIARLTGRSPGTISEELKRNAVAVDRSARKKYSQQRAQAKAHLRRRMSKRQCLKVAMNSELQTYVTENIEHDQSPEGIAGRLKNVDTHLPYASMKAIYKFVRSPHGRKIEPHLYSKAVKRRGGPKRGERKVTIDGRTMIDTRSKHVENRKEFAHFEGDFIESGKDGHGSLLVLVERKTRYPFLVYTLDKSTAHINNLVAQTLSGVSVRSLTLDNDLSFQKHQELSELVDAVVFFCHPYCSSEKGTVENRNHAIRRYVPKRTDLSIIPPERFKEIEQILRTRYMKCLDFNTPQEAWDCEMEKGKRREGKKQERATLTAVSASIIQHKRCSA
jgi:transposase, IS30 family